MEQVIPRYHHAALEETFVIGESHIPSNEAAFSRSAVGPVNVESFSVLTGRPSSERFVEMGE